MPTTREGTGPARTFWWERARPVETEPLRAVVFSIEAMADSPADVNPRQGLIDLVMSLFVAGIWVAVVTPQPRAWAEPLVRQLVGDGLVETIVTGDDLPEAGADVRALALWEMGIGPQSALAIEGSAAGVRAALAAGLPTIAVVTEYPAKQDFAHVAAVRSCYDGADPLRAASCERLHRQWSTGRTRAAA